MSGYIKDPQAVLDFAQDWSSWLAPDEVIDTASVTVPTGLDKATDVHTDTVVTVWVSGGTEAETYPVTYRVTTNQGRTDERTDHITIRQR